MTAEAVRVSLETQEHEVLVDLFAQLQQLLTNAPEPGVDPALDRLFPSIYPDDEEASDELRLLSRADDLNARVAELASIRASLDAVTTPNEHAQHEIRLTLPEADVWMRAIATLRIVLAVRLGIVGSEQGDLEPESSGIYDWLGYRLELLISEIGKLP